MYKPKIVRPIFTPKNIFYSKFVFIQFYLIQFFWDPICYLHFLTQILVYPFLPKFVYTIFPIFLDYRELTHTHHIIVLHFTEWHNTCLLYTHVHYGTYISIRKY